MYPPDCYMLFLFCVVPGYLSFVPLENPWKSRENRQKSDGNHRESMQISDYHEKINENPMDVVENRRKSTIIM